MYCGDETGAFIGDVGSHTARFGYGGEDCPKVVVPSAVYEHFDGNGVDRNSHKKNTKRVRFSAPVSLMNFPPNDCFRTSPTPGDRGASDPSKFRGDGSGGDVGFIPIYQSLNSNEQFQDSTGISEDGLIQDMDAWACLWEHSYDVLCVRGKRKHTLGHKHSLSENIASSQLNQDMPVDHPLLAVDSTSTVIETSLRIANACERQRALMLETLFESLSAPAAYLAPSAMLSSFSYGRQTALVVDVGHTGTRVTPIVDGYVLKNGSCRSGRGGKWLCSVQQSVLEGSWRGNADTINKWNGWSHGDKGGDPPCRENGVIPRYVVHSQFRQDSLQDKKIQLLRQCPFHSMTIHEAMYEMITSPHIMSLDVENYYHVDASTVPFCGYGGIESDGIQECENMEIVQVEETEKSSNIPDEEFNERKQYELPDGTVVDLKKSRAGGDLCRIPELLFSVELPSFVQPNNEYKEEYFKTMMPIQHLIHQSLNNILDSDVRKELCSSILLTGASSLLPGMGKKISLDLGEILPSTYKCKVIASKYDVERKYAAWIGGSILSSLGSFQQLWLSRREYDEYGAVLGLQRFKS